MPLKECPENWEMEWTRTGASAHREFISQPGDDPAGLAPKPGEKHRLWDALTVHSVKFRGLGKPGFDALGNVTFESWRIIVDYSLEYKRPGRKDGPRVSWEYSCEALQTAGGRVWADTHKKIDPQDLTAVTFHPMMNVTIDVVMPDPPWGDIAALTGKINASAWVVYDIPIKGKDPKVILDVEAETLLFEGAQVTAEYNFETESWDTRLTYKFVWRPQSQNLAWRNPLYELDEENNIQYYQGKWPALPNYRRDSTLWNTPVFEEGAAGVPAWAATDPPTYETGDFAPLLPLP
jgi:hypothetical protein